VLGALFVAQDKTTPHIRSALGASDPRFAAYLGLQLNAPVTRGNSYTVLQNGDEIFPAMLDAIHNARHRIDFESYIYSGEMGDVFTKALIEAARRGIAVRVVLDSVGVGLAPSDLEETFEKGGVKIVWFNPVSTWTFEKTNYRTHRKLLVVDGSVAFTGGVGIGDRWRGNARNAAEWRDTQFKVTGPAVETLEAAFFENWNESEGEPAPIFDPPDPPSGPSLPSIVVWSNASEGTNDVKLLYLYSIASARRSIDIQSPYFVLDSSTRLVLAEARARGVVVRVLTEGDETDAMSVKHAARDGYDWLLEHGIQVFEFQPSLMHAKVMVVDGTVSVFGTANFDNRSFELNDEVAIAAADPQLADTLTRAFEHDLERSTTWTLAEWRDRSLLQKTRENFWGLFSEVF
jgi:cardiolipin synthase